MKIAAAVTENRPDAVITEVFEDAAGLLIIETDTMTADAYVEEDLVGALDQWQCEAILCGEMYDSGLFEAIAGLCVTRYYAGGLPAMEAAQKMMDYELPYITDYVGGHGCDSHDDGERHCTGECGAPGEEE